MIDRSVAPLLEGRQVALVASAADRGGAHVAALRLHYGLINAGVSATYVAGVVQPGIAGVGPPSSWWQCGVSKGRCRIGTWLTDRWARSGEGKQSANVLPSGLARRLNQPGIDIVHLHWVNNELLSIEEIGRIRKPMVWTLHDMWAFCGSEHFMADPADYLGPPGSEPEQWPSRLGKWTWHRKRRAWVGIRPWLVAPSHWIGDLASRSRLLGHLPVEIIPYGLDLDCFRPRRERVSEEPGRPLRIVFGAAGGGSDPRKGFDLFAEAMGRLSNRAGLRPFEIVFFGSQACPTLPESCRSIPVRSAGVITSDEAMAALFAEADVFVAASRLDNLPNTVLEATACGVPTVAFKIGGMPDMIEHCVTGCLARPFDVCALADGIAWVLGDDARLRGLRAAARGKAEREFGSDRQAGRMIGLYDRLIAQVA